MKISSIKLILLCIVLATTSCSSSDDNQDYPVVLPEPNLYDYYVDSTMQKSIDQLGIKIHKGTTPPTVEGVYTIDPFYCANSNFADALEGTSFGTSTLTLSNQNTARLSIDFKNFLINTYDNTNETWEGKGTFISGEGNNFSILFNSDGELDKGTYIAKYKNLIILSGELDTQDGKIKGIKNLQMASIMSDDYKDPYNTLISIGKGRLFINSYASIK
jgi:hypothetical protein